MKLIHVFFVLFIAFVASAAYADCIVFNGKQYCDSSATPVVPMPQVAPVVPVLVYPYYGPVYSYPCCYRPPVIWVSPGSRYYVGRYVGNRVVPRGNHR